MDNSIFNSVLETFENDDIRKFAQKCMDTIPAYWYLVPASSTGKYHPQYSLGDGGLARHTLAVVRLLNHMLSVDCIKTQYTSRERDLLRVAAIMHDSRKSGSQEEFEKSKWTKFNHPILAADVIKSLSGLKSEEIELIAHTIESHMGQFNTDKKEPNIELPKPHDKYQIIIHVCDYLASRKDIELLFDNYEKPDINSWIIPFGKYAGKTIIDVYNKSPSYIEWAKQNINSEPMKSLLKEIN